jgi:integrase
VGSDRLEDLSDSAVARFLEFMLKKGRSTARVNCFRAHLVAIATHAYDAGLIDRPLRVKKLKTVQNPPQAWTEDELRRIFAVARVFWQHRSYGKPNGGKIRCNHWWDAILSVTYETALRRGALLATRRSDVDLETGWLVVDGSSSKTLRGQGYKLSDETIAKLRRIWKPERKLLFAYASLNQINRHFEKILTAAGVRRKKSKSFDKFHRIRRSTASIVCATAGITAAQNLLGHTSAEVTRRSYIDPTQIKHDVTGVLPALDAR